ncbi:MAG: DUF2334 domain-containing protein [Candidatus Pacearchaeota archaeon]|jgi:predicted deacetylase
MKLKKIILQILSVIAILLIILFLTRLSLPRQIDDVSPNIPCDKAYLEKSDVLYVIPSFEKSNISDNNSWCNEILYLNKTLALHGYHHNYHEFLEDNNNNYLKDSISVFEKCFNKTPERFKPPQLSISNVNQKLVKIENLKLDLRFNQITHKVYHCNDSGDFPNWLIDWF